MIRHARSLRLWFVVFIFASPVLAQTSELDNLFIRTLKNKNIPADSLTIVGKRLERESVFLDYQRGVLRASILIGLGHLYSNRLDSAATNFLTAIETCEADYPGSFEEGLSHNYMGSVFTRMNNHPRALREFIKATSIFESLKNIEYKATSISNEGTAYGAQNDLPKALERFLEAYKLASDPSVTNNQRANILSNISIVYNFMGKKKEALQYAFSALELDKQSDNQLGICQSYNAIANIYSFHQSFDSALFYFDRTLSLTSINPDLQQVGARAMLNKGEILLQLHKLPQAIRLLRNGSRLVGRYQIEIVNERLGKYYRLARQYDSAKYFSRLSLREALKANSKSAVAAALENLREIYFEQGRFDSAYFYQGRAHAYRDSTLNESTRAQFDKLNVQLATLDKENEIRSLQKDAALANAKNRIVIVYIIACFVVLVLLLYSIVLFYKNKQKEQKIKALALEDELAKSNANLRNQALRMIHMSNGLQEIEENLKKLKGGDNTVDIQHVIKSVGVNKTLEKEWESFNEYFGNIHIGFYEKLEQQFPQLTTTERRLAGLVRMDLTNREIASILNIEDTSVKTAKHRLKKKLALADDQSLYQFLVLLTSDGQPGVSSIEKSV